MPISTTKLTLPGDGVTLAADRWLPDDGPIAEPRDTVLLLHGGGQTRHSWRTTGQDLAGHGWPAIAIDTRGHGDSGWAVDGDYSVEAMVRDLRAAISHLGVRPVLVGASMGGMTSLVAQGADPSLASALVLVDITPRAESRGVERITEFMLSGVNGFDTIDDAVSAVASYNPHRQRAPRPEGLMKNLRERDGRLYWHWDPQMLRDRSEGAELDAYLAHQSSIASAAARSITVPTLLVKGAQSDVVSDKGADDLLRLIPGAHLIEVNGAGHMVAGDDNSVFTASLVEFLEEALISD